MTNIIFEASTRFASVRDGDTGSLPSFARSGTNEEMEEASQNEHELIMWLSALESFVNLRNHPFSEVERDGIISRDFSHDAHIVSTILRRTLQLTLGLMQHEDADAFEDAETLNVAPVSGTVAHSKPGITNEQLIRLAEALSDLLPVCRALCEQSPLKLDTWRGFGKVIIRELNRGETSLWPLASGVATRPGARVHPELLALTNRVIPDSLGADFLAIFTALTRLLQRINFVGTYLRRDHPLKELLPVFTLVHEEGRALLNIIESRALRTEGLDGTLFEALDGTAYAIGMELRKVFTHELIGFSQLRQPSQIFAKVETAFGLLRGCFENSTVVLAQTLDPALDGTRLFNNYQNKLEQSLILRRDLWTLLLSVRQAEREREGQFNLTLLERVYAFRDGSIRYLMYKDWESYERFVEELSIVRGAAEFVPVLHRFATFLEALFGQINMRAVLTNEPFDFTDAIG